jgi:hypothetical protein
MIATILPIAIATTVFLSSTFSPIASSSSPQVALTRVLPEKNFVAHTVENGETLKTIARDYYKDEKYWTTVWNDNDFIKDPEKLEAGWLISIRAMQPGKPEELKPELAKRLLEIEPDRSYALPPPPAPLPATPSSYDEIYKQAGAKYGIPWQILYGIHMTETGGRNGAIASGYGSGAQGPMQFMPGTWKSYAVDGDGNGVADINDATDAIYAAANFIAKHGSVEAGLRSYGGNTAGTLALARARGLNQ